MEVGCGVRYDWHMRLRTLSKSRSTDVQLGVPTGRWEQHLLSRRILLWERRRESVVLDNRISRNHIADSLARLVLALVAVS